MKTRAILEANLAEAREQLARLQGSYYMDVETGLKTYARPEAIAAEEARIAGLQAELAAIEDSMMDASMELPVNASVQSTWAKAFGKRVGK